MHWRCSNNFTYIYLDVNMCSVGWEFPAKSERIPRVSTSSVQSEWRDGSPGLWMVFKKRTFHPNNAPISKTQSVHSKGIAPVNISIIHFICNHLVIQQIRVPQRPYTYYSKHSWNNTFKVIADWLNTLKYKTPSWRKKVQRVFPLTWSERLFHKRPGRRLRTWLETRSSALFWIGWRFEEWWIVVGRKVHLHSWVSSSTL